VTALQGAVLKLLALVLALVLALALGLKRVSLLGSANLLGSVPLLSQRILDILQ
jgi:hypothetical protein